VLALCSLGPKPTFMGHQFLYEPPYAWLMRFPIFDAIRVPARFGLPAIHNLAAELKVSRWRGEGLRIEGRFSADLDQICVVSLEAFRSTLSDTFESYFLPAGRKAGKDEAAIEEGDAEPFENGVIDMGEAVAEAMAVALDPYPKKPGVSFEDIVEDTDSSQEQNPFAGLSQLKKGKG